MTSKNNLKENSNSELYTKIAGLAILVSLIPISLFVGLLALSPAQTEINECDSLQELNTDLETGQVQLENGTIISVEIADTFEERGRGLMCRSSLEGNSGMIFIFPEEQQLSFWMKNTLIPLDIIFLNSEFEVVSIHKNTTPLNDQKTYQSELPAQYALELKAGSSTENSLQIGDAVIFTN